MGHTIMSGRQAYETMMKELADYAKALDRKDRETFLKMLNTTKKHVSEITFPNSLHAWAFLCMCLILEQQKTLSSLTHTPGTTASSSG